jgi:hypothetical protein
MTNLGTALASGRYTIKCYNKRGILRWSEVIDNLVVNEGLSYILQSALSNETAAITSWYVGLLATSPTPLATWTATEIASNDFVDYTEGTLPAWTAGTESGQSVSNSSTADFSINTNSSVIGGAYLISTSAKATPAGTLYSAGAFSGGDKNADSGDTLQVTATFTQAAA